MAHITLYPATMTPALWVTAQYTAGLGRLPDAVDPVVSQKINGDWSFSMRYPINGVNYELLQMDLLICAAGQLYRINGMTKVGSASEWYMKVSALHILYDLQQSEIPNIETTETDPDGITQAAALALILAGTDFTVGTVDDTTTLDYLDILQKSPFWALKEQILALWGGELQPDNWTIHIKTALGESGRLYPVRRGRNIKGITYNESLDGVITRLHVSGYGGATFEDMNDGKDYIDSANLANYAHPREGRVEFADEDDPAALLVLGIDRLATVDQLQVKYDINLASLRGSDQYALYAPLESFNLGDTARIHHDFFDVDIITRNIGREFDPVTGDNIKVTLGNTTKDLYKTLSDATKAAETIQSVVTDKGKVRAEKLQGTIDTLVARLQASGSYANAEVIESQGFLLENTNSGSADFGALYLGCGILALASEKAGDNSWIWRTFGTGKGFTADEIVTGTLLASLVKITGTDDFFWEGDAITLREVASHKIIKLGKYDGTNYGLAFSTDDGVTWKTVISFDGLTIQDGAITALQIAAGTITALQIAANTITAAEIAAGTITATQIAAYTITALQLASHTITADQIAAGTITATEIATATITASQIAANTITANLIAAGTITVDKIASTAQNALVLMSTNAVASSAQQLLRETLLFDDEYWTYSFPAGSGFTFAPNGRSINTMLIDAQAIGSDFAYVSQDYNGAPSTAYCLSVNYLLTNAPTAGQDAFVRAIEYDSAWTPLVSHYIPITSATPNADKFIAFTSHANCAIIQVQAIANAGYYIYWEKPKLAPGSYAVGWSMHPEDNSAGLKSSSITIIDGKITVDTGDFIVNADGSVAIHTDGNNATINSLPIWHGGGGGSGRIWVSTTEPPNMGADELWVQPDITVSKNGAWTKAALSSRLYSTASNYELTGVALGAGEGTYHYTVQIPIYHNDSNTNPYNVTVYLAASSGGTTINMGTQSFAAPGWFTATVTDAVWLGNATSIWCRILLQADGSNMYIAINSGKVLSVNCEDVAPGAASGIFECKVYQKKVVT